MQPSDEKRLVAKLRGRLRQLLRRREELRLRSPGASAEDEDFEYFSSYGRIGIHEVMLRDEVLVPPQLKIKVEAGG